MNLPWTSRLLVVFGRPETECVWCHTPTDRRYRSDRYTHADLNLPACCQVHAWLYLEHEQRARKAAAYSMLGATQQEVHHG